MLVPHPDVAGDSYGHRDPRDGNPHHPLGRNLLRQEPCRGNRHQQKSHPQSHMADGSESRQGDALLGGEGGVAFGGVALGGATNSKGVALKGNELALPNYGPFVISVAAFRLFRSRGKKKFSEVSIRSLCELLNCSSNHQQ